MYFNVKNEGVVGKASACTLIGIDMDGNKEVLGI
jgi:transposase-like protein